MLTCVWGRIAGFHINSTCWQQHTHTRVRCIVFMSVNWCRTNYIGSRQGKFEQCCNYSMLHFVLCHRKPLCRHLDKRGNEDVRRGEKTNGLQWSSRSRRIVALGYGSYVSTDWVRVKSDLQYLAEAWTHKTKKTKKVFWKGLKLVSGNKFSTLFYQLTPSLYSGLSK